MLKGSGGAVSTGVELCCNVSFTRRGGGGESRKKAMNIYISTYKTYWSDHSAITEGERENGGRLEEGEAKKENKQELEDNRRDECMT